MDIHKKEPVVLIGLLASAIAFLAGHFGIVLDHATIQTVIEPLIVSFLARPFVSPKWDKVIGAGEDVAEKARPPRSKQTRDL